MRGFISNVEKALKKLFSKLHIVFWYITKQELRQEYDDNVLYPLATEQVKIDLDDGVKVNYGKFGGALSPIKGLRCPDLTGFGNLSGLKKGSRGW